MANNRGRFAWNSWRAMRCPSCVKLMQDGVKPLPICGFFGRNKPVFRPQNYRCATIMALQLAMKKLATRTYGDDEREKMRTAWSMKYGATPVFVSWKRGSDKVEHAVQVVDGVFQPMLMSLAMDIIKAAEIVIDDDEVRDALTLPEGDEDMDNDG